MSFKLVKFDFFENKLVKAVVEFKTFENFGRCCKSYDKCFQLKG